MPVCSADAGSGNTEVHKSVLRTIVSLFGRCLLILVHLSTLLLGIRSSAQDLHSSAENLLGTIVADHLVNDQTGDIPGVLAMLVAKTRFKRHVNINKPPIAGAINFYLLPPHLGDRRDLPSVIVETHILGNCVFVGVSNAIVCDPNFLETFLDNHNVFADLSTQVLPSIRRRFQIAFLAWVLGHELGHVMEGTGAAHFGEAQVIDANKAAITLQQKRETDADLYAARQIQRDRHLTTDLEDMLLTLINQEIVDKVGVPATYGVGLNYDYRSEQMIRYFADQDHPEFIIRATRILEQLSGGTKDLGLENLVYTFSRHLVQAE